MVRQTLFYVLFTAQFRTARIFYQYKFLCTVSLNLTCSIFRYDGTIPLNLILLFYFPLRRYCSAKSNSIALFSNYDGTDSPNLLLLFYFHITIVLCRIADFRTQACNVTLNPALVLYLGKLPVDAAIHALIFRPVNR